MNPKACRDPRFAQHALALDFMHVFVPKPVPTFERHELGTAFFQRKLMEIGAKIRATANSAVQARW
jgi:hypothetical protein